MRSAALPTRGLILTSFAMLAFAGNSLLCRAALRDPEIGPAIDPATFTAVRLVSGAFMLLLILSFGGQSVRAAARRCSGRRRRTDQANQFVSAGYRPQSSVRRGPSAPAGTGIL